MQVETEETKKGDERCTKTHTFSLKSPYCIYGRVSY